MKHCSPFPFSYLGAETLVPLDISSKYSSGNG
jgi:hypothetical protein